MSIAIWTDSADRVTRKHYKPSEIDTSEAYIVESDGTPPDVEAWVDVEEYYTEVDGFTYQTTDPFGGLGATQTEKESLFDAIIDSDLVKARQIIENIVSS